MYLDNFIIVEIFSYLLPNCKYQYKIFFNLILCSKLLKKMILSSYKECHIFRIEKKNKNILGFKKIDI